MRTKTLSLLLICLFGSLLSAEDTTESLAKEDINNPAKYAQVEVLVEIDEEGKSTQIEIRKGVSKDQPELRKKVEELVRTIRHTPPMKDGKPTKQRFILPIKIEL